MTLLKKPSDPLIITTPFSGDKLQRQSLADNYTALINRFNNQGAVVLVDAKWGEGKTWFARNWAKYLGDQNHHNCIYIDAFSKDFIDDPFLIVVGEILRHNIIVSQKENFIEIAANVGKAVLPTAAKVATNIAGIILTGIPGTGNILDKALEKSSEAVAETIEKNVETLIKNYAQEVDTVEEFKKLLTESIQQKKLIIFVDELDRCKPNFAVKFIERIKHLFDVPNLTFVIFTNRDQLEKSIIGVYGEIDATTYLTKFIDITLNLPSEGERRKRTYLEHIVTLTNFPNENINGLSNWVYHFDLSLREIEKFITLLAVSRSFGVFYNLKSLLAICKLKFPDIFSKILNEDYSAYVDLFEEYKKYQHKSDSFDQKFYNSLSTFISYASQGFPKQHNFKTDNPAFAPIEYVDKATYKELIKDFNAWM